MTASGDEKPGSGHASLARRALARNLRKMREASDVTYEDMRVMKLASKSAWHRYEAGDVRPTVATLRFACEVFDAGDEMRDQLLRWHEQGDEQTYWEALGRGLPTTPHLTDLLELEAIAPTIEVFGPILPPGLVQSKLFQAEMFSVAPGLTTSTAQRLAEVREHRQAETLGRADLTVIIGEEVLTRQFGGPQTMREQRDFLAALDATATTSILVLPFSAGAHPGGRGEFALFDFPESSEESPHYYGEGYLGGEVSSDPRVIEDFRERFATIKSKSVPFKEYAA